MIPNKLLPEGPFGDHLGYYSLAHDFPVLRVDHVYHRNDAIWPFTVVGRPPQEDTIFGQLIHELTGPVIPTVLPGVVGVHAVDAAGVHPLLLAIGSERYLPFLKSRCPAGTADPGQRHPRPRPIVTGEVLVDREPSRRPKLEPERHAAFFRHMLQRADWTRDLHFQTKTTIDTLDYSGGALNSGSKVVIAAVGPPRFELATELSSDLRLPDGFSNPRVVLPGVLAIEGPKFQRAGASSPPSVDSNHGAEDGPARLCSQSAIPAGFRLLVIVDDSQFVAESLRNFLWVTFTRTNPAADIHGIDAFTENKHWGCRGPLVIDARLKPHHAPPLVEDPEITRRVDSLAAPGGPLYGIL